MLDRRKYTVARQENDGDCLPSSLGVIASLVKHEDMLLSHPVLAGDGETMRAILSDHVADMCASGADVVKDLSWRAFVEAEAQTVWSDAVKALSHSAVYQNGRVVTMGTFAGDVFIKAFEKKYGVVVPICTRTKQGYDIVSPGANESTIAVALLRSHNHFDVIVANDMLAGVWEVASRSSKRCNMRAPSTFVCENCRVFSGAYRLVQTHEASCAARD